jgi:hypothetical protein
MYISEGYVTLSPTELIIYLLLTLADRQNISALFKSPSSDLPVDNRYTKIPRQWDPLLLTLADRQHVSALFKSPSSVRPVHNRYNKIPHQWDPIT